MVHHGISMIVWTLKIFVLAMCISPCRVAVSSPKVAAGKHVFSFLATLRLRGGKNANNAQDETPVAEYDYNTWPGMHG
jgi:hypothetical protein